MFDFYNLEYFLLCFENYLHNDFIWPLKVQYMSTNFFELCFVLVKCFLHFFLKVVKISYRKLEECSKNFGKYFTWIENNSKEKCWHGEWSRLWTRNGEYANWMIEVLSKVIRYIIITADSKSFVINGSPITRLRCLLFYLCKIILNSY